MSATQAFIERLISTEGEDIDQEWLDEAKTAPLRCEISGRADLGWDGRQIACASSVKAAATRLVGVVSTASS